MTDVLETSTMSKTSARQVAPGDQPRSLPSDPERRPPAGAHLDIDWADGRELGAGRGRWRPLLFPAASYLASRVVMVAVAAVVGAFEPAVRIPQTFGTIFDNRWYLLIAQHGYPHVLANEGDGSRWAFFPAFPALVRGLAEVTRLSLPDAAALSGFVFGLTSALAIFLAVREVAGARLANRAVLLYVCFPTAYVLSLGYTEGFFLTLAAGCLFALSRRAWVTAGLCACLAGATRSAGVVVIVVVVAAAVPAAWRTRSWRPIIGAALAPVGLVAFMAYSQVMVRTPIAFVASERFWHGQHFVWFRTPAVALFLAIRSGPTAPSFVPDLLAGSAVVLGFLGLWWLDTMSRDPGAVVEMDGAPSIPASWWIYTVGTLLVAYSADVPDSIARYAMVAFPLFVAFGWKLRRWTVPVAGLMVCAQAALFVAVLSSTWRNGMVFLMP
jgi:hypothetical protein